MSFDDSGNEKTNIGLTKEPERTDPIGKDAVRVFRRGLRTHEVLMLFFTHKGGTEARALYSGVPLVVGREAPAEACIADSTLSREHARFTLEEEGGILVEDLGSTNGTWHRERRVDRVTLQPGGEVMLGGVMVRARTIGGGLSADEEGAPVDEEIVAGPAMRLVLGEATKAARSEIPVIITGETGTGKELMAHFLHRHSHRAEGPLVCVNCGAIPSQLLESTLFGHEKGAFTGAQREHKGVFETADGGTIFLDEIGELPAAAQVALLRVLETGRFTRVGAVRERQCDVRILAATHRDLVAMCEAGDFREDLYYRLASFVLSIPSLRERKEDIEALSMRLLREAARRNRREVRGISPGAISVLRQHTWPGNIRELKNVIVRAVVVSEGEILDERDLPARLRSTRPSMRAADRAEAEAARSPRGEGPEHEEHERPDPEEESPDDEAMEVALDPSMSLKEQVLRYEAQLILKALEKCRWNRKKTAALLGMPLRTLAHKIKSFEDRGLIQPEPEE